jgi:hypothetical protein
VRLRCYLPSTSAIVAIAVIGFLVIHAILTSGANHPSARAGIVTMVVIAFGVAGLAAGIIAVSAVTIRRRRAAAGACHTCSHPCREAMVPLPELDAPLWPHRPLSSAALPVTVIPRQRAAPLAEQPAADRVRIRA